MAKLVGVIHENEEDASNSTRCLARRQLPLTIGESKIEIIIDVKLKQTIIIQRPKF